MRSLVQRGQVKRSRSIEDNDLVGRIRVDGLVQREVGRGIVVSDVQSRRRSRERVCEAGNELLEISLPLGNGDRRSKAIVVIERREVVSWLLMSSM